MGIESQSVIQRFEQNTVPLSVAQERLWFLSRLDPNGSAYNLSEAFRINGSLNIPALEQSLNEIVRRHEALRATFSIQSNQSVQTISSAQSLILPVLDISGLEEEMRESHARYLLTKKAQQPFDLGHDLLLRAMVVRLGDESHILLLSAHRIAADTWSMGILVRELAALYLGFHTGISAVVSETSVQYVDFAHWQRQWLREEVQKEQLSYWRQQLDGSIPALDLPTDRPRPAVQSYRGSRQSQDLPKRLSEALKSLSEREGVSLFITLLAAFQSLLHRYTGQDDIIIGSPIPNRDRPEFDTLIGCFVNALVLRTDLSGDPSFAELLDRARRVNREAQAHHELPIEKLIEALHPKRELSRTPLFQVTFQLMSVPPQESEWAGLDVRRFEFDKGTAEFDLSLTIVEDANELSYSFEYNTDLFDAATIKRMSGHFQNLLEGILASPEQPLSMLPLITSSERQQLLVEWNNIGADHWHGQCVHELFEIQAKNNPEADAVVYEDECLSYQELNAQANQLAHYLKAKGVGPEVLVGICLERSVELIVGLLGILKAGGAYVPLDPSYPKERLAQMIESSEVPVLLTEHRLIERLPVCKAKLVDISADWKAIKRESMENPGMDVTSENLAYVIFTSGSTGKPKGVQIRHRSVASLFGAAQPEFHFDENDVWTVFHSFSFDLSVWEIWGCLLHGGRLVVVPLQFTQSPEAFYDLLRTEKVTVLSQTPSAIRQLIYAREKTAGTAKDLDLRLLVCGGEALPQDLVPQLFTWDVPVWNFYGPTEATVWATIARVNLTENRCSSYPIGHPLANTRIHILDHRMNLVPIGIVGELYIGGAGLARGYLNLPELTAERFVPDPLSGIAGARLYKTGDLGRYLPDGSIEYVGRADNQVKIHGFRVELGEIEAALANHPGVGESVVAVDGGGDDKHLVAYIVPHPARSLKNGDLRGFLKQKLPEYMLPSAFVLLDAMPLSPNGKVNRRALSATDGRRSEREKAYVGPRDSWEIQLKKIWEDVLGISHISVKDNFFELGGQSLLAVRLFAQIEKLADRKLPLATLFQAPTIEQLASVLRHKGWSAPWSSLVAIQTQGSRPPFFCVHGVGGNVLGFQLLAHYLGPDQPFYALQAQGLDGGEAPFTSVEDIAAQYVKEIRAVDPDGPYFLGGFSFGGVVAFEMGRQLQEQGKKVALLVMFDAYHHDDLKYITASRLFRFALYRSVRSIERRFNEITRRGLKPYFLKRGELVGKKLRGIVSKDGNHSPQNGKGHSLSSTLENVAQAMSQAERHYVPKQYGGKVTYFWPGEEPLVFSLGNSRLIWSELAGDGLEVQTVPGSHETMVQEPHIVVVAEKLRECLRRARASQT